MIAAFLWVLLSHIAAVCYGLGRMDAALLFNADAAAYGTAFGPHVRVATTSIDGRLLPASVTVQAWIMPLPRSNGQLLTGPNDLGQVLGNMARTFTPSRIFAGYSIYCKDSSAHELSCSFFVATSTTSFLEPSCRVPMQNWTHVTGVYDSSTGVADVFINGSKCSSSTNSGGSASISYFLRSSFLVGGWIEDAPGTAKSTFYFSGRVDEVRVWASARTRAEILSGMFDTIPQSTAATTPSLRLYLPCNDSPASATVSDVTSSFIPSLQPAGLVGGLPTFVSVDVDVGNSLAGNFFSSAMDRPVTSRVTFGQQVVLSSNTSADNTFILQMQKANTIVISVIDPNPTDTAVIGTPSFYPSAGGLPNGAVMQQQVVAAAAYATPGVEGVVFSRTLLWLPSFESDWLIPAGGLPVSIPLTEIASNPLSPSDALPARPRNDLISFKLYVAAPPEFLSGSPLNSLAEVDIVAFIGLRVSFDVRARDRNKDETVLLQVAYDPGLPNFAAVSPPTSDGLGSVFVTRSFAWTPTCGQARPHSVVFEATSGGSKTQQRVNMRVVEPSPTLIEFDSSLMVSAPGCSVQLVLNAADSSVQTRALGLSAYGHVFSYNVSDATVGQPPISLPYSTMALTAGVNAFGGNSAILSVMPEFVHGGRTYVVCATVKDACGVSAGHTRCRQILVQSCKICAGQGATLSSLALQFGTDFSSLYAVNPMLPNPDLILLNSVVAIGGTHASSEGQTLQSIAEMFQTRVDKLRRGNPSFANFSSDAALAVGTPVCIISHVCELEQQCESTSGSCQV